MTYTTTAAAQLANVTTETIRAWARMGAIRATKAAGRWVIEAASLTKRIAMGIRRTRKATTLDLNSTYTVHLVGHPAPVTLTPKIRTRTGASGSQITTIKNLIPLLADKIDAITDEGDRLHTLEVLSGAQITLCPTPRDFFDDSISTRDEGRIATIYVGTRHISVNDVLDLGEKIRTHLDTQ